MAKVGYAELKAQLEAEDGAEWFVSLEDLLTSAEGFGLTTATNVQRAACWVLQENTIPDRLWDDPEVKLAFGTVRPTPRNPLVAREVLMLAGIRGGKTLICAAAILWFAVNARLDIGPGLHLKRGERPRASILSATKDNAFEAYNYLQGALTEQPKLMPLLHGKPRMGKLTVRHRKTGRLIDIRVVALDSRRGVNLVSRWCVAVLFDEAPRISSGEADGKVNLKGMVSGVRARLLYGAPIIYIGSPVGAIGLCYELHSANFGKEDNKVTVIQAKGRWLNPVVWTPEVEAALKESDYDTWLTDCEATFRDVVMQLFSSEALKKCFRETELVRPAMPGKVYTAWMDPGMRRNAWTLLVSETIDNVRFDICLAMEWQGSTQVPLNSFEILQKVKEAIAPYGITGVGSDQYAIDPLKDIARTIGLEIYELKFTGENKTKRYKAVQTRVNAAFLSIPYSDNFRQDMLNVKQVILSDGSIKIRVEETEDGRHCDFAAGLALLCGGYLEESDEEGYKRAQGELPTEDEEHFETDNSFAARAARDWRGDDEPASDANAW